MPMHRGLAIRLALTMTVLIIFAACAHAQRLTVIQSPAPLLSNDQRLKIFLGGSIDMGQAEDWQSRIEQALIGYEAIVLNPRRDDWNKNWQPVSSDKHFKQQVEWELSALEYADLIVMYFVPGTQSPISLLEFGLYARTNKLIVLCPEGFWRKGNVDIVAERYKVKAVSSFEELVSELKRRASGAASEPSAGWLRNGDPSRG